jgi:hypothetical protein
LSRPVNPHQVSEPLALPRPVALLLFPTCADVHGVKVKPRGVPRLREEIADGTYIVRTAGAGDLDPEDRGRADRAEILSKSPSEMRAAAKLEVGSRAGAPSVRDDRGESGRSVRDICMCVSAATLPNVPTTIAKTSWDAWQGMFDNLLGTLVG